MHTVRTRTISVQISGMHALRVDSRGSDDVGLLEAAAAAVLVKVILKPANSVVIVRCRNYVVVAVGINVASSDDPCTVG